MPDGSDYFRGYARDVGVNPPIGGADNVQDALAGFSAGALLVASVHLDAAAIGSVFTAPTTLIPAPGAGQAIVLVGPVQAEWVPGTEGINGISPALFYGDSAGTAASHNFNPVFAAGTPPTPGIIVLPIVDTVGQSQLDPAALDDMAITVAQPNDDPYRIGPVVSATLADGGAGYAVNDTGTIDPDTYAGGAAYRVTAVAAITGAVTAFTITAPGDGYTTEDNPLSTTAGGGQPGAGTGLTVNVTGIPPADGDLYVTVAYRLVALH